VGLVILLASFVISVAGPVFKTTILKKRSTAMSDDTNLAGWGAEQIAGGAFGAVGSGLFGMALSGLSIGFPDSTDSELQEIQSQLTMIENQLVNLNQEVDDVMNRVGWDEQDTRRQNLDPIMVAISEASTYLNNALAGDLTSLTSSQAATDRQTIMGMIRPLLDQLSVIHLAAVGDGDDTGLYDLLVQNLKGEHRFLSSADSNAVKSLMTNLQSAQFVQFSLVAQYYRANGDSQSMIDTAQSIYQSNITEERNNYQYNKIWDGVVFDQVSGLEFYYGACPYVDYNSAQGVISQMNENYAGDAPGWRLPTIVELLGEGNTKGIFSGYNNNDGTPPQWLKKHGVPNDMTGIHFWTSNQVPPPVPTDFEVGRREHQAIDYDAYNAAFAAWQAAGPPHYFVDSANLGYFGVKEPDSAHVVAVRNPLDDWEGQLLVPKNEIDPGRSWYL
jgi:hypothetical protein